MKTSLWWKRLLIGCLLLASLAGCASGAAETPVPPAEGTQFPTGKFVNEEVNWAVEFDEDGTWRGFVGDTEQPVISGRYAAAGKYWTEMTHDYPTSPKVPATYYWTYDGKNLTFRLWGEDVNSHRKDVYDGQTYIKSE